MICTLFLHILDNPNELVRRSIEAILTDECFKVPSTQAASVLATASNLVEWMKSECSQTLLKSFSEKVVATLMACFPKNVSTFLKSQREKTWQQYHRTRISSSYKSLWIDFVNTAVSIVPIPAFYQHVGNQVFQSILKSSFPVNTDKELTVETSLSYEEANALRYAAGYVCHKVDSKIKASTHPMKDKLILCLMDLCDEDEEVTNTSDWINAIDRGGLVRISENTFEFFRTMEMVLRCVYNTETVQEMTSATRENLCRLITTNDDVLFYWCMVTVEVDEEEANTLLEMIVNLWITVRGYSFAKSWMEMYKQAKKKSTQKCKALRRNLLSNDKLL